MPFTRPTLQQLIDRVDSDIRSGLGILTLLRRSFLGVISKALAGLAHLLFGRLDYISRNTLPDIGDETVVRRWAKMYNVPRREATFAELQIGIVFTGPATVDDTTIFQINGQQYRVTEEVTAVAAGTQNANLVALVAGEAQNLIVGDSLSIQSPIANVESSALVTAVVTDADDQEDLESWRARLLTRLRLPPLGGSANDYIQWALEIPGVTRAWVLPLYYGAGTVGVSFVLDDEADIIPDAAKVTEVDDYIETKKPVTALVTTFAPTPLEMDLTINIKPNTAEVQTNITNELIDLVKRDATLAGSYKGPSEINTGTILLSKINQAISIAVGLEDHEIDEINGNPPANIVPADGELIVLGNITFGPLA